MPDVVAVTDYPRGSEWRKWDLHVHTPSSIVQDYGGPDPWERFLDELESLPDEFKVIGINDYLFLDGYKRILQERENGRLTNIDLFLPVIEFRLDKFGGSESKLRKVNFHVIFSDELQVSTIEGQFLPVLRTKYALSPEYSHILDTGQWEAFPDRESLADLGQKIIDSVPETERGRFGSPLIEGFNNLCFSIEGVQTALSSHYFRGRYVTAVGKTEWAAVKWNDQSIAEKKNIINSANLVFISSENPKHWAEARQALTTAGVNDLLLDCSDAHAFRDASTKDRLGKCYTWIKADTTFRGLLQIMNEPEERVFIGDEPPKDRHVKENQTKYISSVRIERKPTATLGEIWFDNVIPMNPGLVAVIGNRGKGKSALTDTIGLLCNSRQYEHFTFLSGKAFQQVKNNKAQHFLATLEWQDGSKITKGLDEGIDWAHPEFAKYIPQNFLEKVCAKPEPAEETDFDREIKQVIFSHVPETDKSGAGTLDELISFKTAESSERADLLRRELHELNVEIVSLEKRGTVAHREAIENLLKLKRAELGALEKPADVPKPSTADEDGELTKTHESLDKAKAQVEGFDKDLATAVARMTEVKKLIDLADKVTARLDNLEHQILTALRASSEDLKALNLDPADILQLEIDRSPIHEMRKQLVDERDELDMKLDPDIEGSLAEQRKAAQGISDALRNKLDEPSRLHQEYLTRFNEWEKRRVRLTGSPETADTVKYYEHELSELDKVPSALDEATRGRMTKALEVFSTIEALAKEYGQLYSPVHSAIAAKGHVSEWLAASFSVHIVDVGFLESFFEFISHGVAGSYCGLDEGRERLANILAVQDFSTAEGIKAFLEEITDSLYTDLRFNTSVVVDQQLRKSKTAADLFDCLFSLEYLQPRYSLRLAGKEMHELSPGERGILLLVFYLLVDKSDIPLIIDQPEENLDNQTVYEVLKPSIQAARKARQIIIVTHNPNLAVVCDADQIIHADLDKAGNYEMRYTSGAIENPKINKAIVDVLEGTKPAFDNRDSKYFEPET